MYLHHVQQRALVMTAMLLNRVYVGSEGAFGTLAEAGKPPFAVTLEHTYNGLTSYSAKLPDGTYSCVRGKHTLLHGPPFVTFEVTGVPGHSGILFHKGNVEDESEGCILLGLQYGTIESVPGVLQSISAFTFFMSRQSQVDEFSLTVTGG
jgi:hypothetical protein